MFINRDKIQSLQPLDAEDAHYLMLAAKEKRITMTKTFDDKPPITRQLTATNPFEPLPETIRVPRDDVFAAQGSAAGAARLEPYVRGALKPANQNVRPRRGFIEVTTKVSESRRIDDERVIRDLPHYGMS